jgi:uncharacterized membrane protein YqiK
VIDTLLVAGAALPVLFVLLWVTGTIRYIPNHKAGVVEKLFSPSRGSVRTGFLALDGEAGFQPHLLRGGWHVFPPFQYRVHAVPLVTIPQGGIGYVYARDGRALEPDQVLARNADAQDFQDVVAFLQAGGQRGPQRRLLREGTSAINLAQFAVFTADRLYALPLEKDDLDRFKSMAGVIADRHGFEPVILRGADDRVGIVTVHDGPALDDGEIIAPTPSGQHDRFQDADRFLALGGRRGRQLEVLVDGTWYINRLFATVELIPKTTIEVGTVGVVVSYTGRSGVDVSGESYKHGELVQPGERGVWCNALMPGKYAFNTYAGKVVMVPTTNFILKWNRSEVGQHRYDENLAEVGLITRDAFEPSLPLSVVVHIDYRKAPLVVQRFGDVKRLVEQTLDPMVAAFFKNIGQTRTLIELIHERAEIQRESGEQMREKFHNYNLELEEVLIGTPSSGEAGGAIETVLGQIRARQIAHEQVETYARQQDAAVKERMLREAEARASRPTAITDSELGIAIAENEGRARLARAVQEAAEVRTRAEADAEKTTRLGIAAAIAAEEQVRAYGGARWQVAQQVMGRFAEAVETAGVEVVPRVLVGSGANGGVPNAFEGLLAMILADRGEAADADKPRSPEVEAIRDALLKGPLKAS